MRYTSGILALLLAFLVFSAEAGSDLSVLSDEELDQVSARGFSSDFFPFAQSETTTTIINMPININTITVTQVNANPVTAICTNCGLPASSDLPFQIPPQTICTTCGGSQAITSSNPIQAVSSSNPIQGPTIVIPQTNTFTSNLQATTLVDQLVRFKMACFTCP